MARAMTSEELLAAAEKAEKRARELKAKARRQTQAERARAGAELMDTAQKWAGEKNISVEEIPGAVKDALELYDAVDIWRMTLRNPCGMERMPQFLREWAERNRAQHAGHVPNRYESGNDAV